MTDLTDQDRRAARSWAKNWQGDLDADISAAARVILATVDAPEPTLTEELRDVADSYGMSSRAADRLDDIADRVEHDLAEARAEVERAEDRAAEWQGIAQRYYAKVELLTAERDEKEVLDTIDAHCDHYAAQKGAESNAESLDPADVKPGEAWIVDVDGERRTAVKDRADDVPWSTIDANGRHVYKRNENVTLITRLVPAPRVITNADELDRLAEGAIIRDNRDGEAMQKFGRKWVTARTEHHEGFYSYAVLPSTVLWEPEA